MGVYIKDMKMPKNCGCCPLLTGTFCDILNKDVDPFYEGAEKRDNNCPLVDLGRHGRLIDADALVPDICHDWNGWRVPPDDYSEECIRKAPIVIEAEGEG